MRKIGLILIVILLSFSVFAQNTEDERGYVPFVWGTYSAGQRVRLDFEKDRPIDYIEFSWDDASEDKNTRVELYVDYMYEGSKRVWMSWETFYLWNKTPRFSLELRVVTGKVNIRRAYIQYKNTLREEISDFALYTEFMQNKGIEGNFSTITLNNMTEEEQIIVFSLIHAINDEEAEAVSVLKQDYEIFVAETEGAVDISDVLFTDKDRRGYVFASGYYYNGSRIYLNLDKNKKVRSINVSWSTEDDNVRGDLYIDGMYQGGKYIRSYSYDTFYIWDKEVRFDASIRISGGNVRVSSVYVNYSL